MLDFRLWRHGGLFSPKSFAKIHQSKFGVRVIVNRSHQNREDSYAVGLVVDHHLQNAVRFECTQESGAQWRNAVQILSNTEWDCVIAGQ